MVWSQGLRNPRRRVSFLIRSQGLPIHSLHRQIATSFPWASLTLYFILLSILHCQIDLSLYFLLLPRSHLYMQIFQFT